MHLACSSCLRCQNSPHNLQGTDTSPLYYDRRVDLDNPFFALSMFQYAETRAVPKYEVLHLLYTVHNQSPSQSVG